MMKKPLETLLDQLIEKAGQAQVVRMFRNSAMDAEAKLVILEKEMQQIRAAIVAGCQ